MNKKKISLLILLFIVLLSVFIVPKTISKYTKKLSRSIVLNVIEIEELTYFKAYDGSNDLLGFDKTDITSFARNTTFTKQQVLEIEGVELISNTEDDGYTSTEEVYGWVDNNVLYWWSEADVVYFHPHTLNAFKDITTLVTVDLRGASTSKVENFSCWFNGDTALTDIYGKINTSGFNNLPKPTGSMVRMFSNCRKLRDIDVSEFDTRNVKSMDGLFNCCMALTRLDLRTFDTSNAVSMIDMFATCNKMVYLNVSTWDTSKVEQMGYMFYWMTNMEELDIRNFDTRKVQSIEQMFANSGFKAIYLGDNFDTTNMRNMYNAFSFNHSLEAIYVKHDFVAGPNYSSAAMFSNSALVGGFETDYEFPYDSSKRGIDYAKISNANQEGYFTYLDDTMYNITYDLDGGTIADPITEYFTAARDFTLNNPTKAGYLFIGWTGDNGNEPNAVVTIPHGSTGDRHYVANYVAENDYYIEGPCTFRGENNTILGDKCKITSTIGNTVYFTNSNHINTGLKLFNTENIDKDFEITFTIDSVTTYTNQATLLSSMMESGSPWPGFVFRISTSDSKFQLRAGYNGNANWFAPYTAQNIKIIRENKILKYSVDGGALTQTVDFNNPLDPFDYPVTIGAGLSETMVPRRFFKGTISNIRIKIYS